MTTYYIDPTVSGTGTGTIGDPFQDWSSVSWSSGNSYLQKRGTTYRKAIVIGADNVTIGAYGTGVNPVIRADQSFAPTWTAQANGEYSCPSPANTFSGSSLVAMFIKNGSPVTKRGSVGSLAEGECQSSGTTIYYKPVNGDHTTASFAMLYQDYGFTPTSAAVRNLVTIEDIDLMYVYIGFYSGNNGGTESATNWTLRRVRTDWTPRGGIHFVRGGPIVVEDSTFSKFTSTGVNFGLVGGTQCNNVTLRRTTVEEGGAWISDTNLEGHALDMVEGCSNLVVEDCIFMNHGALYPSTAYAHAGGSPSYRPDATLSFDGVSNVVVRGTLFENNCLAPIQCGDYVDGAPVSGNNQQIYGNIFKGNLKKFASSDSSNATLFTCIQILGTSFTGLKIYNNTFVDNGNGLRLTPEHQRPCLIYAVTTTSGTTYNIEVKNNIFGVNDVSSLLVIRIVAASGTIPGANIASNVYETQTSSQWLDGPTVTNYIYIQPNNANSYQVPDTSSFEAYQAVTSADAGSLYQIDSGLDLKYWPRSTKVQRSAIQLVESDFYGEPFSNPGPIGAVQFPYSNTALNGAHSARRGRRKK